MSTEMTETVINSGNAPLVITDISTSGRDRTDFTPTYGYTLPVTVAPGSSIPIDLTFNATAPWRAGTRDAKLKIQHTRGVDFVPLTGMGGTCLGPFISCLDGCPDSDGDGLNDAWKSAGGIDLNNDGIVDASEQVLTNIDPIFPDGTTNPHPSAERGVKDVFVKYDWMELPDQLTNGQPTACTVNPLPSGPPNFLNIFYPYHSDQCAFDQACLNGVCKGHSDEPSAAALKMVIEAFARHNIHLHLVRGHALPHSNVVSYGSPVAACTADLSSQTFSGSQAVDFYALKAANFNASYNGQNFNFAQLFPIMHYSIFGHHHTCDTVNDCAQSACTTRIEFDRSRAFFAENGLSEKPGNDMIVSQGYFRDRNQPIPLLAQGGTFMHELGHNLGLDHGGPLYVNGIQDPDQTKLNYKPNYISVMNYNYQFLGIGTASPNCAPDDYVCKTTPVSVRLDYSSFQNGVVPNTLDENNGTEAAGINTGNDIGYTWCSGVQTPIPGTGPVDFNCNGIRTETWCAQGCDIAPGIELNKDPAGQGQIPDGTGNGDVLRPYEDWPNLIYRFQCEPTGRD